MSTVSIATVQFDPMVGDLPGNAERIADLVTELAPTAPDLIAFPELCLCGYPPEDLLFRPAFLDACEHHLQTLARRLDPRIGVLIGHPQRHLGQLYNAVSLLRGGRVETSYRKHALPNYAVFDERRYFESSASPLVLEVRGRLLAILICEDLWQVAPAEMARRSGAELLLCLNASPFAQRKHIARVETAQLRQQETGLPVLYVNQVGAQDELVFDGASFGLCRDGQIRGPIAPFQQAVTRWRWDPDTGNLDPLGVQPGPALEDLDWIWRALVAGLRGYVVKNRFPGVLLGLSGGIDSALTLALAVEAVGAERVHAVMMPFRWTSPLSLQEAAAQAQNLGVEYTVLPIDAAVAACEQGLAPLFAGRAADVTEENLQSRCRGIHLMAISNKFGKLLLATGNKSEMAVGYATLYGDMCGGYAPIKDLYKTQVYALSRWRNARGRVIPNAVIERPPSAELRPDQVDQDSLPPYPQLDAILERYIERDQSVSEIVASGHHPEIVTRIVRLLLRSEFKRRQAPPGTRITGRAFGRDRRYPITSGWRDQR